MQNSEAPKHMVLLESLTFNSGKKSICAMYFTLLSWLSCNTFLIIPFLVKKGNLRLISHMFSANKKHVAIFIQMQIPLHLPTSVNHPRLVHSFCVYSCLPFTLIRISNPFKAINEDLNDAAHSVSVTSLPTPINSYSNPISNPNVLNLTPRPRASST